MSGYSGAPSVLNLWEADVHKETHSRWHADAYRIQPTTDILSKNNTIYRKRCSVYEKGLRGERRGAYRILVGETSGKEV